MSFMKSCEVDAVFYWKQTSSTCLLKEELTSDKSVINSASEGPHHSTAVMRHVNEMNTKYTGSFGNFNIQTPEW